MLPRDVQKHPRIVLQRMIALNRIGQPERLLESGLVLPDIREAIGLLPKPLPYELDFRMH